MTDIETLAAQAHSGTMTTPAITDDIAWAAMSARDRRFDGRFVTGVHSTGIYCRPSCSARHPKRENVRFYADGEAARVAGLRPCLRCRPDDLGRDEAAVKLVLDACQTAEEAPKLEELAELTSYSPSHLQRLFSRAIGLSPAAYFRALRAERAGKALSDAERVTDAIYDAGYSGPSRFYAEAKDRLGMSASAWKNGGKGAVIHWTVVPTSLGAMLVAATDKGVCRLSFDEEETDLRARFPNAVLDRGGAAFEALVSDVLASVEAPGDFSHIPIDVQGTAFQEAVWRELRRIPPGETRSYAEIAAAVGKPKAIRAAGSANGANNVAVLIPCHRVVRTDGSLGGYAYGLDRKRKLLELEKSQ